MSEATHEFLSDRLFMPQRPWARTFCDADLRGRTTA
jgi:hypothetical protein